MLGVGRLHLVVLVGWISIFFYPYRKTIIKVEAPTKEFMDVLTNTDQHTSISKMSSLIHNNGDYHREFHVWIYVERARDLLLLLDRMYLMLLDIFQCNLIYISIKPFN